MLTKETVSKFRKDFEDVSAMFQEKYGMKLSIGTIRFDSKSFKTTLSGLVSDPTGEAIKVEEVFSSASALSGIDAYIAKKAEEAGFCIELSPKGFVGSIYRWPSKRFPHTITGIKEPKTSKEVKNFIEMEASSGTKYIASIDFFRSAVLIGHT